MMMLMFQWAFVSSGSPPVPTPTPSPSSGGGGRYPTVARFDEGYLRNERLRKQRLVEDEEFIIFLS